MLSSENVWVTRIPGDRERGHARGNAMEVNRQKCASFVCVHGYVYAKVREREIVCVCACVCMPV